MAKVQMHLGSYDDVLRHVKADLILTSPPYNIGSKAERQDGRRRAGKYDPKSFGAIRDYPDSLPENQYQNEQEAFLLWCADHLAQSGTLVYNHKPRRNGHMIHPMEWILRPAVKARLTLMEEVIWDRGSTHNHGNRMMWPQTERLYVFRRADGNYSLLNHRTLPQRSDVWRIGRATSNGHNAPFPEGLAAAVIEAWSKSGDLVCDPYSGSGTTALVARSMGRNFEGSEIMPKYHALCIRRLRRKA